MMEKHAHTKQNMGISICFTDGTSIYINFPAGLPWQVQTPIPMLVMLVPIVQLVVHWQSVIEVNPRAQVPMNDLPTPGHDGLRLSLLVSQLLIVLCKVR